MINSYKTPFKRGARQITSIVLAIIMIAGIFAALPFSASAADVSKSETGATSGTCGTNATWSFDSSTGTLTISGFGDMDNYTLNGDVVDDMEVSNSPWGLAYNSLITSIVIEDGITSIGDFSFFNCTSLTTVEIPNTVTYIGIDSFSYSSIQEITIPDSVTTIGVGSFHLCTNLSDVILGNGISTIGDSAFCECYELTNIIIPDGVSYISEYAFGACMNLTTVELPDSVTSIGGWAFSGCSSLENINITDNVIYIGDYAFEECCSLIFPNIPNGCEVGEGAFSGCINASDEEPENATEGECGANASWSFDSSTGTLTISGTGKMYDYASSAEIPWNSFRESITHIEIEYGITHIGNYSFSSCGDLLDVNINIANSVTSIGEWAFESTQITNIIIPDSVTTIGNYSFADNGNLTNVTFGNNLTTIGDDAFQMCRNLTTVTIPDNVATIGDGVFRYCFVLENVTIGTGIQSIGSSVFDDTTIINNSNNWNNNACYIDNYLVKINNSEITTCNVLDGTKVICNGAFYNCPNLTSVTIPDSITTLSSNLFSVCPCLTTVSLPSSITTIKQHAFYNCSNLKFDSFPSNLKNIEDKAIAGCKYIGSYNNVLWNYNENNHSLIFIGSGDIVTGAKTSALLFNSDVFNNTYTVSFSDGITSIGKSLFCGFRNLTSVTIPDSITHIGDYAFKSCRNLISLTLPDSVTYIGNWAFFNCDSLKNINIPDSVTSIGKYTFDNCFSLNSIIIPDSVTSIGESAFSNCTSLSSAIIGNDVSTIGARAFLNCPKANIVASDTVRSIGDSAFYHCNMVICPLGSYTYNLLTSDNFTKYRTSHTMVVGIVTAKTQLSYILRKKNSNSVSSSVSKFKISTGAEAKATTGDDVDSDIEEEVLTPEQIADNLSHVQCYVVKDLNINDTLTFDSDLDVTLHLNDYQTDSKGNVKVDSNGNIVDGEVHTISGSSSEALIEVPGNLTISTTGEANGGITNDKGSVFDVKDGGSLTIENGTYSEDVSEYIDDDKVISKTNGLYTVIDPSTEDLTLENDGRQVIMPAGQNTFARNDLTGVQLRAASTSEYDIEGITHTVDVKEGMRFVSVVRSDILRGAVDYGYVLVKGKNVDNMNTRKSDIYVGSDGCVTMSLKGTKNSLANTAYSSANLNEGKYKYLTATVHNIDDDNAAIGARFYIKRADGTYVYADYTCVATMAMLKAA